LQRSARTDRWEAGRAGLIRNHRSDPLLRARELSGERVDRALPGRIVVSGGQVGLSLPGEGVGLVGCPLIVPFGAPPEPVTARVGEVPKSPLITLGPVFVTPAPARIAKLFAVPRPTDVAARELAASAKAAINAFANKLLYLRKKLEAFLLCKWPRLPSPSA
jgi:hypothetical protein